MKTHEDFHIHPDVLVIATALCSNPAAYRAANIQHKSEYTIRTDPCDTLAAQAIAIVRRLRAEQIGAGGHRDDAKE